MKKINLIIQDNITIKGYITVQEISLIHTQFSKKEIVKQIMEQFKTNLHIYDVICYAAYHKDNKMTLKYVSLCSFAKQISIMSVKPIQVNVLGIFDKKLQMGYIIDMLIDQHTITKQKELLIEQKNQFSKQCKNNNTSSLQKVQLNVKKSQKLLKNSQKNIKITAGELPKIHPSKQPRFNQQSETVHQQIKQSKGNLKIINSSSEQQFYNKRQCDNIKERFVNTQQNISSKSLRLKMEIQKPIEKEQDTYLHEDQLKMLEKIKNKIHKSKEQQINIKANHNGKKNLNEKQIEGKKQTKNVTLFNYFQKKLN